MEPGGAALPGGGGAGPEGHPMVGWVHDVGVFLRQHRSRFPAEFARQIPRLASISRALSVERERSFYGDKESGLPPEMLYSEHDATEALEKAALVLDACRRLIVGGEE